MNIKLKYLNKYKDRHGNLKIYYRRNRKLKGIELTARPIDSTEFMVQYMAAQSKQEMQLGALDHHVSRSLNWLYRQYSTSDKWQTLNEDTKNNKRRNFMQYSERFGHLPIDLLDAVGVKKIRDEKLHVPNQANNRLKDLRAMFAWALSQNIVSHNPCNGVAKVPVPTKSDGTTGHKKWTIEQIQQWFDFYPPGTKQHLALAIIFYTGARRSDVVKLGPGNLKNGVITFVQTKNRDKVNSAGQTNPKTIVLKMLPGLQKSLDAYKEAHKVLGMTWLTNQYNKPYSVKGFGKHFRNWRKAAGLPDGLSTHGLRKSATTICAENGATTNELLAIFGWSDIRTAQIYVQDANALKLATEGLNKLIVTTEKEVK